MALNPIALLASAALLLGTMAALMIRSSCGDPSLRDWGFGFGAGAIGLAMVLASPNAETAPVRVLGNVALMFGFGLVWAAARRFRRGSAPRPTATAAGALAWLVWILVASPTLGWRIGIGSLVIAAYGVAAACELLRDGAGLREARGRGGWTLAAHGVFHALRAVLGAIFGFAAWGSNLSQGWGGVLGFETMLFAVLFGTAALAMCRDRVADTHGQDALEDALEDTLTGIGNRCALFASGVPLVEGAAASGRPLALLLMDLDGFKAVNDRHGPAAGDRLLVAFARLAHDYLPPTSLVCRLGGDRFVAVLPGADGERARAVGDALRSLFAHLEIEDRDGPLAATVSIGFAEAERGRPGLAALMDAAARAIAAAKRSGGDRVAQQQDICGAGLPSVV